MFSPTVTAAMTRAVKRTVSREALVQQALARLRNPPPATKPPVPTLNVAPRVKATRAPLKLPPAPRHYVAPRHQGPHELRAAVAAVERWLRLADVVALSGGLSRSQVEQVEQQQTHLRELRRFAW